MTSPNALPHCFVIAGPNGVGKSTAAYSLVPTGIEQINPDDIARQLRQQYSQQEVILQMTNDESRRRMDVHIARKESFGVETNLYDEATWRYFIALQQCGYVFDLLFLCTSRIETLVERVKNRYRQGGHFVRDDVIRERYLHGLYWLNHFFDCPDSVTLFDTSSDSITPVYKRVDGVLQYKAKVWPQWTNVYLPAHFGEETGRVVPPIRSAASIQDVRDQYDKMKKQE